MFERFPRKIVVPTAAALLAALGVGGAAIAQSNNSAGTKAPAAQSQETPGQESNAPENSATDTDNVQEGDQSSPDKPGSAGEKGEKDEKADSGKESATEQESGSEQPNDDGPGGHADEPGNPNADQQAQGQQ